MYTYTPTEDEVFESLKTTYLDETTLEPLDSSIGSGPKLFGESNGMYGKTHTSKARKLISDAKLGKISAKDSSGNKFYTTKEDPKFLSGEVVGIAKGKASVRDKDNNKFLVDVNDPRFLSGELVGVNKGKTWKQKVPSPLKGTFLAKDRQGNMCRLTKTDPRYISGEFIHFRSKF